jgi:hypothetical protein
MLACLLCKEKGEDLIGYRFGGDSFGGGWLAALDSWRSSQNFGRELLDIPLRLAWLFCSQILPATLPPLCRIRAGTGSESRFESVCCCKLAHEFVRFRLFQYSMCNSSGGNGRPAYTSGVIESSMIQREVIRPACKRVRTKVATHRCFANPCRLPSHAPSPTGSRRCTGRSRTTSRLRTCLTGAPPTSKCCG